MSVDLIVSDAGEDAEGGVRQKAPMFREHSRAWASCLCLCLLGIATLLSVLSFRPKQNMTTVQTIRSEAAFIHVYLNATNEHLFSAWANFSAWEFEHRVTFGTVAEEVSAFAAWKRTHELIVSHNADKRQSYTQSHNHFSHTGGATGLITYHEAVTRVRFSQYYRTRTFASSLRTNVPASKDWRNEVIPALPHPVTPQRTPYHLTPPYPITYTPHLPASPLLSCSTHPPPPTRPRPSHSTPPSHMPRLSRGR